MQSPEIGPSEAQAVLFEAGAHNPGPWITHSVLVGHAARRIASATGDLDPDQALAMGLLHDVGRIRGVTGMRHATDGYRYLTEQGLNLCATVSLSHSFPDGRLDSYIGQVDVEPDDLQLLRDFLAGGAFSDYDKLIQLCDFIATGQGYCLAEVRMVDTVLRYGNRKVPTTKWEAIFNLLKDFGQRVGGSVYGVLPGIAQGTFGNTPLLSNSPDDSETKALLLAKARFRDLDSWKPVRHDGM